MNQEELCNIKIWGPVFLLFCSFMMKDLQTGSVLNCQVTAVRGKTAASGKTAALL